MDALEKKMRLTCDSCMAHKVEGDKVICELDYKHIDGIPQEPCECPSAVLDFLKLSMAHMRKKH